MNKAEIIANNPIVEFFQKHGVQLKPLGRGYRGLCPFHDDHHPSLDIDPKQQVFICRSCHKGGSVIDAQMEFAGVACGPAMRMLAGEEEYTPKKVKPMKLTMKTVAPVKMKPVKNYIYKDEVGSELYRVVRYEPKSFRPWHREGTKWAKGIEGIRRVLYNLPEIIKADKVYVCEGEKDADTVNGTGRVATTNIFGSSSWLDAYAETLRGKKIVICPDSDPAGHDHTMKVLGSVSDIATWVKILDIPAKDITDYLSDGGDIEKLEAKAPKLLKGIEVKTNNIYDSFVNLQRRLKDPDRSGLNLGNWLPSLSKYPRIIPGELMLIVAATGHGKTAALQNVARIARPLKVLMFELELPEDLLVKRQIGMGVGMSVGVVEGEIRKGHIGREDLEKLNHIYPNRSVSVTVEELKQQIVESELVIGQKPDVVMLDYIQLMQGGGSRYERMSDAAEGLKRLAKETNTIVIVASQASRPEKGQHPQMSLYSPKDSGGIENSAGFILGINKDIKRSDLLHIAVLKCTSGDANAAQDILCSFDSSLKIKEIQG